MENKMETIGVIGYILRLFWDNGSEVRTTATT